MNLKKKMALSLRKYLYKHKGLAFILEKQVKTPARIWRQFTNLIWGVFIKNFAKSHLGGCGNSVLYVLPNFVGDALLSTAVLKHLRDIFYGYTLVIIARSEIRLLVEGFFDEFIEFIPSQWERNLIYRYKFLKSRGFYKYIIGGVHMCGSKTWLDLFAHLDGEEKFLYEGYFLRTLSIKSNPAPVTVIPSLTRSLEGLSGGRLMDNIEKIHVLNDEKRYLGEVLKELKISCSVNDFDPVLRIDEDESRTILEKFGLHPRSYLCVGIGTKEDSRMYPVERLRKVMEYIVTLNKKIVLLGTENDTILARSLSDSMDNGANLFDLTGKTSLQEAIALVASSKFVLGLNSAISHIGSIAGIKTLCILDGGRFGVLFPYPQQYKNVYVINKIKDCYFCNNVCKTDTALTIKKYGVRCMREIEPQDVIDKIKYILDAQ